MNEKSIPRAAPGVEVLAVSLHAAIDQSFTLNPEEFAEVQNTARLYSRSQQEGRLNEDRQFHRPGLRLVIAEALCSGDIDEITQAQTVARERAIAAVKTDIALEIVKKSIEQDIERRGKKTSLSSTIDHNTARKGLFANL